MLTPAQHLDNDRRRRGPYPPLSKVTHPDAKLLYLKPQVREAWADFIGCGSDPSHERDVAYDEWDRLYNQFQRLVAERRSSAALERAINASMRAVA